MKLSKINSLIFLGLLSTLSLNSFGVDIDTTFHSRGMQEKIFYEAKQQLENMLSGKEPLNYEKAIFITENAYYENLLNAEKFYDRLTVYSNLIEEIAKSNTKKELKDFKSDLFESNVSKYNKYKTKVKNWAIYKFMTDTVFIKNESDVLYHKPYSYSNLDPLATKDWTKSQVVNLMGSNEQQGNCYALTSLYKILAERLKTDAKIATAPNHVYIVHKDENNITYNVELATKTFPGNGSIETITYTTDKALKSHIALRYLTLKQSVALNLVYLAKSYQYKFKTNNDEFLIKCANAALKYDSLNLNAMLLKAEISENILFESFKQKGIISPTQLVKYPEINNQFKSYEKQIVKLYDLGYIEMPIENEKCPYCWLFTRQLPYTFKRSYTYR